jgi:peptidoglycan hydrolase-like protein with peptidoglycan-binding domain
VQVVNNKSFRFTKFLEEGSYGNEVRELQRFLNEAGYDAGKVDGVFGAKV